MVAQVTAVQRYHELKQVRDDHVATLRKHAEQLDAWAEAVSQTPGAVVHPYPQVLLSGVAVQQLQFQVWEAADQLERHVGKMSHLDRVTAGIA